MRSLFVYYANYISNLNPNHTLQLTTLRTSVRLYIYNHRCSVVTISARSCIVIACYMHGATPFKGACSVVTISTGT